MKKTLLAVALMGAMGTTALVNAASENAVVDQRVEQMKSEFNLNDQQAQSISKILNRAATPEATKAERKAARIEKRMERRLSRMQEKLDLSDAQVAQFKTIMTQQRTQMQALREQGKASMIAVLTPEQATKFAEMKNKRMERGHHRGGHGGYKMHRGGHGGKYGKSCDNE